MKFQEIGVATARINGLTKDPYYFEHKCFWAWDIMFSDTSNLFDFDNIPFIKVGDTEEEAVSFCKGLKENFSKAHIKNRNKVTLLLGPDVFGLGGRVHAISRDGRVWIDVDDKFTVKLFKDLSLWK